ncbi:MAG: DNA polymerase I [Gammaproteobacteria bacterium]|nr:DNA polymerase I [Gammaproteobacteria bacterium]MCI0590501.1 DNA polymerase I [Gammaproteobacteria bacterium]
MSKTTLVLVDGSSYLYRAFHALPALANSRGEPTGAIYGVIGMLRKLKKDYQPAYMAVVFDAKGKTFRDELYPEYKAHRPPMPAELVSQLKPLHEVIRAMGLPVLMVEGVEGDDVIGTLAIKAKAEGLATVISTGDKDLTQLVDEHVCLVDTMNNAVLDVDGVQRKFGIPPSLMVDYLTLIGDSVDNVPGVPKVGPKTAVKWLKTYHSLDSIMAHADEIPGKVGENLRASLDKLPLSRELVTLRTDVPLGEKPKNLTPRAPDRIALQELFTRLEFKSWLSEYNNAPDAAPDAKLRKARHRRDYKIVRSKHELQSWIERLQKAEVFAFDTETNSLDYIEAEVVGVSFAVSPGEAAYVPVAHDYEGAPKQLSRHAVLRPLRPLLEDPGRAKLGHNLKFDMSVLANHDIALKGIRFDTMLESYVLDSTATRHDMDSLALKYLGAETIHFEDVAGKGAKQLPFNRVPLENAAPYAAEDADVALRLHQALWPKLEAEPGLRGLFEGIEIPLIPVLSRMERNGVMVDPALLERQSKELAVRAREIEREAHDLAGQAFNMGSPKQIQTILYDKLQLPVLAKTPKGAPSTAESVLQDLALDYPLPKLILEHRAVTKLKSTYTDKLPIQINSRTGRVHTSYHQAVAATGRLSSSAPNLQNIPVRTTEGRRIRQAFIAAPGYRLLAADYSQIELRIMAHLSGDQGLKEAFANSADIHTTTAAEVFGMPMAEVNSEQRRAAKAINFGLIYGMSAFGLGKQLGIDRSSAQVYVDRYFNRYPGVKAFMEATRAKARAQGFVETVFKRRLYLPDINARNAQRRQYAERTAINAPMQGTAADIIKCAMIAVDAWLTESAIDAKMVMQVHDELVFEIADEALDAATDKVRQIMENAADLSVPLVVGIGVGNNWDEAH